MEEVEDYDPYILVAYIKIVLEGDLLPKDAMTVVGGCGLQGTIGGGA